MNQSKVEVLVKNLIAVENSNKFAITLTQRLNSILEEIEIVKKDINTLNRR
jgi:hypothetical protein